MTEPERPEQVTDEQREERGDTFVWQPGDVEVEESEGDE